MTRWKTVVVGAVLAAALAVPRPAAAGTYEDAGWGALAMLANVGYMPAKLVYGLVGGLTGGLAYACTLGDLDTAQAIWVPSLGGDYVLTPAHVRGDQAIAFSGTAARDTRSAGAVPAADPLDGLSEQPLSDS